MLPMPMLSILQVLLNYKIGYRGGYTCKTKKKNQGKKRNTIVLSAPTDTAFNESPFLCY